MGKQTLVGDHKLHIQRDIPTAPLGFELMQVERFGTPKIGTKQLTNVGCIIRLQIHLSVRSIRRRTVKLIQKT